MGTRTTHALIWTLAVGFCATLWALLLSPTVETTVETMVEAELDRAPHASRAGD